MRCNKNIKAARDTYLRSVRQAKQQLSRTLTRHQERLTRSGNLEAALAVKNLAKKVEQDIAAMLENAKSAKKQADAEKLRRYLSDSRWTDGRGSYWHLRRDGTVMANYHSRIGKWEIDATGKIMLEPFIKASGLEAWKLSQDGRTLSRIILGNIKPWKRVVEAKE